MEGNYENPICFTVYIFHTAVETQNLLQVK